MITKKELASRFSLSLNTVRKTLEACGLDTSKAEYTEEEVIERFEVARKMLEQEQKSYAEVAAQFGVTLSDDLQAIKSEPAVKYPKRDVHVADPLQSAIRENVEGYVQEVTDEALADVVAQLPQMIYESAQKLVKSGAIDDVFQKMLEQRRAFSRDLPSDGRIIDVPLSGLPFVDEDDDEDERQWEPQD
jgi:MoxR-like ATPase